MARFSVKLSGAGASVETVAVEASGVICGDQWLIFDRGQDAAPEDLAAAFPRERVISVERAPEH